MVEYNFFFFLNVNREHSLKGKNDGGWKKKKRKAREQKNCFSNDNE